MANRKLYWASYNS